MGARVDVAVGFELDDVGKAVVGADVAFTVGFVVVGAGRAVVGADVCFSVGLEVDDAGRTCVGDDVGFTVGLELTGVAIDVVGESVDITVGLELDDSGRTGAEVACALVSRLGTDVSASTGEDVEVTMGLRLGKGGGAPKVGVTEGDASAGAAIDGTAAGGPPENGCRDRPIGLAGESAVDGKKLGTFACELGDVESTGPKGAGSVVCSIPPDTDGATVGLGFNAWSIA